MIFLGFRGYFFSIFLIFNFVFLFFFIIESPVAQGSLSKKLTFPHRCGDEHISECVVMTTCVWSGPHVCGDHNTHVVMTTHMPDGTYVDITPPVWTSTNIILP